jgi:hypothetical protein
MTNAPLVKGVNYNSAFWKKLQRWSERFEQNVLEGAVAHGYIEIEGKSDAEIKNELVGFLQRTNQTGNLLMAIDHTADLRKIGQEFEKDGKAELASVIYAIWVEHVLNSLISIAIHRRGQDASLVKQIIRDVSFAAKLDWLMPLLGYSQFSRVHAGRLKQLAEFRNTFAHYKWTYADSETKFLEAQRLKLFLADCRKSFQYLVSYKTKGTLAGAKNKIRRVTKSIS